jgi:hypothetical protein
MKFWGKFWMHERLFFRYSCYFVFMISLCFSIPVHIGKFVILQQMQMMNWPLSCIAYTSWAIINISEELKSGFNSNNAYYHSVQNLPSSGLLSKNVKIKFKKIIIFIAVSYRCETWSLTLKEGQSMKVFHNGVLKRISGLKKYEITRGWWKMHNEEVHIL